MSDGNPTSAPGAVMNDKDALTLVRLLEGCANAIAHDYVNLFMTKRQLFEWFWEGSDELVEVLRICNTLGVNLDAEPGSWPPR